jgi:hypothetical protein
MRKSLKSVVTMWPAVIARKILSLLITSNATQFRRSVDGDVAHGLNSDDKKSVQRAEMSIEKKRIGEIHVNKKITSQETTSTHLNRTISLSIPIILLNPLIHDTHDLSPPPSVDENNKSQPREFRFVSLVQPRQLCHHFLAALQLRLLSCTLCRVYFRSTKTWVRSEDGQQKLRVGCAEGEEVRFYCLIYQSWVGGVGSGEEGQNCGVE